MKKNTLVVLPTGLGKTAISLVMGINRLNLYPEGKVILMAPTKPLCQQHYDTFLEKTDIDPSLIVILTGSTLPEDRSKIFAKARVILATPQTVQKDIQSGRVNLKDVVLMTFDEAHRAVSDYSYTDIAKQYVRGASYHRILGLTASPGSDRAHVEEVCKNLFIEDVEARVDADADVAPYVQQMSLVWEKVAFSPELKEVSDFISRALGKRFVELKSWGFAGKLQKFIGKVQLLEVQRSILSHLAKGEKDLRFWKGLSLVSQCIKLSYAAELIETQGVSQFLVYMEELVNQAQASKTKSVKILVEDPEVKRAFSKARELKSLGVKHPKLLRLGSIVDSKLRENSAGRIIVFSSYRDTAVEISSYLAERLGVSSRVFVGQAKRKGLGLSQKEQVVMLQDFSDGKFNVLVGTSITEEGIDIPKVDLVVFYEPIPSAIRSVQRRGRTARTSEGAVIILITENTRDEVYHWVSVRKEKQMHSIVGAVKKDLAFSSEKSIKSRVKPSDDVVVIADNREDANAVVKVLMERGVRVTAKNLEVGDYILGEVVVCERKTANDMIDSLIDGRLMAQMKELSEKCKKPFLVIEGGHELYSVRSVHPNAVRGMLASIALSYGIPIIYTSSPEDTADFLRIVARRMQLEGVASFSEVKKSSKDLVDVQLSILASIPEVGPKLAARLLEEFKTLRGVFLAEDLERVEGVGKKKAKRIKEIFDLKFGEEIK